jgi:hydrogenase maturation factor
MSGDSILPAGKLPSDHLARLLEQYAPTDPAVLVGPGVGEDAAVIDRGDTLLVLKTDPITFVDDDAAWYAVNINANDIACTGAAPKWLLATFLLPRGATTAPLVDSMFEQLNTAAADIGVSVCGGHVEITDAVTRPVVVGCMVGEVEREGLIDKKNAKPGDRILLTKGIPVEAVSIIARARPDEVEMHYGKEFLERAMNYIRKPGISVVADAACACRTGGVKALHDPTEGGLATGLRELAEATGLGVRVEAETIPVLEDARLLCEEYGLDPMGAIASGALLAVMEPWTADGVLEALKRDGIEASAIGEMTDDGETLWQKDGDWAELPAYDRDEIVKLFEDGEE